MSLFRKDRVIKVRATRHDDDDDNDKINYKDSSVIVTLLTMILQFVVGFGVAGTVLWLLIATRSIYEITGNRFRSPLICIVLLSVIQSLDVTVGITAFVWRLLCLIISTYSLKVALILCFIIVTANIAIERQQIIDDTSLQFNRIDDDVVNALENDFNCDLSLWSSDQGSNSTDLVSHPVIDLFECESNVESWIVRALYIVFACVGVNILTISMTLIASVIFHNKHHWIPFKRRIAPLNYNRDDFIDTFII